MGMTITEKILAAHAGRDIVAPGELINAKLDIVMCHDVTTPPAISMLEKQGMSRVFDPDKIVVIPDHFVPNKDIKSAELAKRLREWVRRHGIPNYYEVGRNGVCHARASRGWVGASRKNDCLRRLAHLYPRGSRRVLDRCRFHRSGRRYIRW